MNIIYKLGISASPWEHILEKQNISGLADEGMNIFFETVKDANNGNICRLQNKHTAQLIAAAPEMLEIIIKLREAVLTVSAEYGTIADIDGDDLDVIDIENVIEKATNKSWEEIKEILNV